MPVVQAVISFRKKLTVISGKRKKEEKKTLWNSVFSVVKKQPQRTRRRKGSINSPGPAKAWEGPHYFMEKTNKMFRKGGSNPWKNALKPLERGVRLLEKLTKCIGRTGQTFGRTDSNLWKNGSNSWKN
jgi:hypothetical protein